MLSEFTPYDASEADLRLIHISIELDATMALMILFDGKSGTEQVSLIHGPQAELNRAVDDHLAKHRYELAHTFKECPRCGYSIFGKEAPASCPKGCGDLVDAPSPGFHEDYIRQDAQSALAGSDLLTSKHANLCERIVRENLKMPFPGQEDVRLTLDEIIQILHDRMRENAVRLAAIATKANDPIFLGGRTDLLPQGSTLLEKHSDYLYVRSKLEALGTWLRGLEYDHAEFDGYRSEYPLKPCRFSPPVAIEPPVAGSAQGKEPVEDQAEDFVPADTLWHDHGIAQSRLSEARSAGLLEVKRAPKGLIDSEGRVIRKLYNKKQAVKHCSVKRKTQK